MFVYNGLNTLCVVFILHLLRKARGCCMHVFSSLELCLLRRELDFKSVSQGVENSNAHEPVTER